MELKDTPWKNPLIDTPLYLVFEDKYPVTKGHLLFVPKVDDPLHRKACYEAAYDWGEDLFRKGYCPCRQRKRRLNRADRKKCSALVTSRRLCSLTKSKATMATASYDRSTYRNATRTEKK